MAVREFWKDPGTAEEASAALDDYADLLKEQATSRRDKAEVTRLQGYAQELRDVHKLTALVRPEPRRSNVAELRTEGTG